MIKNKRYKGFSLIEAMVLLTALSLILIAFLPLMLKRSQKVFDSDCVGGLRAVRHEYTTSGDYSFVISDNIASDLTVTLVGAGGGGSNPFTKQVLKVKTGLSDSDLTKQLKNSCTCAGTESSTSQSRYFDCTGIVGITTTYVKTGKAATCSADPAQAGNSGTYYPKYRTNNSIKQADYPYTRIGSKITLKSVGETFSIDSPDPFSLKGGSVPMPLSQYYPDSAQYKNAGNGQGCIRQSVEESFQANGDVQKGAIFMSYKYVSLTYGGDGGLYAKFTMSAPAGVGCSVHVGKGSSSDTAPIAIRATGVSRPTDYYFVESGGSTTLDCNGDTYEVTGGGGGAYYKGTALLSSSDYVTWRNKYKGPVYTFKYKCGENNSSNCKCEYVNDTAWECDTDKNVELIPGTRGYQGGSFVSLGSFFPLENKVAETPVGGSAGRSALAKGGASPCYGEVTSSDCTDPNGKDGILGSGGSGGTCVENGCGSGGRGGDGVAIVEYLEYCK